MKILENVSLREFNSFRVEAFASKFATLKNESRIEDVLQHLSTYKTKYLILGAGSNVLFVSDYSGLVIKNEIRGMNIYETNDDYVIIEVGAGEDWHNFISVCLKNKFYGLENLALIPGSVGAAPVQNIGAYGIEQKDFFHSLRYFDISSRQFKELTGVECKFDYRDSIFKNSLKGKSIITKVRYKLSRAANVNLSYRELKQEVDKFSVVKPNPEYIFNAVCRIRNRKLPDPKIIPNAGSFFKNPIIDESSYLHLKSQYSDIPSFSISASKKKIPAAWLIENCGWKGKRFGDAGVSENHALILVNYGNAKANDILSLAEEIIESVKLKFKITLEYEVNIIGD